MRLANKTQRRAGNVLLLCALILFVIFGVAALVIDLGLARVTQRQMQSATDSAALEGLRYRDEIPPWLQAQIDDPTSDIAKEMAQDFIDTTDREQVRRWMARNQINYVYADSTDADIAQFGAGPLYKFEGGVGPGNAQQTITAPANNERRAYNPALPTLDPKERLQLNYKANKVFGDFVALNAGPNPDFPADEVRHEADNYQQKNFVVADTASAAAADSFLARLRRTNDPRGNPTSTNGDDHVDEASTTGPALPLIFGQASLIPIADSSGRGYRLDGVRVRGTAIAQGRPVLAAGPAVDGLRGVTTFALNLADWTTFTTANAISYIPPTGRTMIVVGDVLSGAKAPPAAVANQVYVPILNDGTDPTISIDVPMGMVLAFGYVSDKDLSKNGGSMGPRIASENATASTAVLRLLAEPIDPKVMAVMKTTLASTAAGNPNQYLLAPALVR